VLAAERGITVTDLGYRRATTLAIAHHPHLAELVTVNGLFCALAGHARHHPDTELAVWLSQRDCQAKWGRIIQAHGFGRWRDHHSEVGFFLHHHPQQQPIKALISVLAGYDTLAQAIPQLATNLLLVWLNRLDQEATLHRLVPPRPYLVATATPHHGADPAEAIWWPLSSTRPRRRLADLPYDRAASTRPGKTALQPRQRNAGTPMGHRDHADDRNSRASPWSCPRIRRSSPGGRPPSCYAFSPRQRIEYRTEGSRGVEVPTGSR